MVKETSVMKKKKKTIKDKLCLIFKLIFFLNSSSLDLPKVIWLRKLLMIGES